MKIRKTLFLAALGVTGLFAISNGYSQGVDYVDVQITDPLLLETLGYPWDATNVFERVYSEFAEGIELESGSFGTQTSHTTFAARFLQERNAGTFDLRNRFVEGMEFLTCDTQTGSPLIEGEIHLPAGALMTDISVWGYDTDPTGGVSVNVWQICSNSDDIGGYTYTVVASDSADSPFDGGQYFHSGLANATVNLESCYYMFQTSMSTCQDTGVEKLRLGWIRQKSPAPLSASFFDVPTNHFFFAEIEALAESGITGGCGGGNFCPDNPVTRAQMAAFLGRALGL